MSELEVTPHMVEAGAVVLAGAPECEASELVTWIYQAMEAARLADSWPEFSDN